MTASSGLNGLDGPRYGYNGDILRIRATEYAYMDGVYLDNAAAPLYPVSIAQETAQRLCQAPLVNPHSRSALSKATQAMVDSVRHKILALFSADPSEYTLVFTASATASAKLVGEALGEHKYLYLRDSHTSLVGLRRLCKTFAVFDDISTLETAMSEPAVVAWPAQSNFTGYRYPTQEWVDTVAHHGGISLVDMASYCSTSLPDLGALKPDLSIVSFYKMFGLPDLGGLIVRRRPQVLQLLSSRKYAGGGTVSVLTAERDFMLRSPDLATSLEDGTLPIHTIASLDVAIGVFERIYSSFSEISQHTAALTEYCHAKLEQTNSVRILSPRGHGPIVTFTLKYAGYSEFENTASKLNIHVRTGTLCNTGAFTMVTEMTDDQIIANHTVHGKTCNDDKDNLDGQVTGVIRVSFGPYSTTADVDALANCIKTYFGSARTDMTLTKSDSVLSGKITQLITYPIKSCAGVSVSTSLVLEEGLKWDREFCLIEPESRKVLSLKRHMNMALITSSIEEERRTLTVSFRGNSIVIPLDTEHWANSELHSEAASCGPGGTPDVVLNMDPKITGFFTQAVGTRCTIAKISDGQNKFFKVNPGKAEQMKMSLSNSSPILLVSKTSAEALDNVDTSVFRANIVITTNRPFQEDDWERIQVGNATFELMGACRRCNMVCVTADGKSDATPYLLLMKHRRIDGKVYFGQHMRLGSQHSKAVLSVGDEFVGIL